MSNFSRQFFCLGLSHTSWPTFVGCGSNNNLVFRAPVVLFWSGTLTCCWWSSCLLLEFLFDFCRCCPWSGIPFPRPSAARWEGGEMMRSSQTAPPWALRAAWHGRVLRSVTAGTACRDGRLLSRPHSATGWEVGDTRPWGRVLLWAHNPGYLVLLSFYKFNSKSWNLGPEPAETTVPQSPKSPTVLWVKIQVLIIYFLDLIKKFIITNHKHN